MKEMHTVGNLKAEIDALVKVQEVDTALYALQAEKDAAPAQIKALDDEFQAKKQHLNELEKSLTDALKARKDRELELGSNEEGRKKLQGQLYALKTNKEYQAMLQQIEGSKADASVIEDKILQLMEQADKVKVEVEEEKKRLQGEEKIFAERKKKVEDRVREIEAGIAQYKAQRQQLLPGIDPKVLAQYERILASRGGLAIAGVRHNSCLGCNMFVPPQVVNLIMMYERVITCEVCNRILYIPDESA